MSNNRKNSSTLPLKAQAKALRGYLAEQGIELGHSKCLEAVARQHGFKNWDAASAFYGPSVAPFDSVEVGESGGPGLNSGRTKECRFCANGYRRAVHYDPEKHGHISEYMWVVLDTLLDRSRLGPVPVQVALQEARRTVSAWQYSGDNGMKWLPQAKADLADGGVRYVQVLWDNRLEKYKALEPEGRGILAKAKGVELPNSPTDPREIA